MKKIKYIKEMKLKVLDDGTYLKIGPKLKEFKKETTSIKHIDSMFLETTQRLGMVVKESEYYISTLGNDKNNGSYENPWQTLKRVNNQPKKRYENTSAVSFNEDLN